MELVRRSFLTIEVGSQSTAHHCLSYGFDAKRPGSPMLNWLNQTLVTGKLYFAGVSNLWFLARSERRPIDEVGHKETASQARLWC